MTYHDSTRVAKCPSLKHATRSWQQLAKKRHGEPHTSITSLVGERERERERTLTALAIVVRNYATQVTS